MQSGLWLAGFWWEFTKKILQVPWLSLRLLKLTWRSCSGLCSDRSLEGLMLGSPTKYNLAPCSGKAFLRRCNKTNQSTSQPLPLSAASNLDAAHAGEPRYPSLGKTEYLNKKLLTAVWRVHAGSGEQLALHRTYQPGSVRKEVCTCGPAVPLHTTPCLMNRHKVGWLLVQREDQQTVRSRRLAGILHPPKPKPQKTFFKS